MNCITKQQREKRAVRETLNAAIFLLYTKKGENEARCRCCRLIDRNAMTMNGIPFFFLYKCVYVSV